MRTRFAPPSARWHRCSSPGRTIEFVECPFEFGAAQPVGALLRGLQLRLAPRVLAQGEGTEVPGEIGQFVKRQRVGLRFDFSNTHALKVALRPRDSTDDLAAAVIGHGHVSFDAQQPDWARSGGRVQRSTARPSNGLN
jgi:hypothetical protein